MKFYYHKINFLLSTLSARPNYYPVLLFLNPESYFWHCLKTTSGQCQTWSEIHDFYYIHLTYQLKWIVWWKNISFFSYFFFKHAISESEHIWFTRIHKKYNYSRHWYYSIKSLKCMQLKKFEADLSPTLGPKITNSGLAPD